MKYKTLIRILNHLENSNEKSLDELDVVIKVAHNVTHDVIYDVGSVGISVDEDNETVVMFSVE